MAVRFGHLVGRADQLRVVTVKLDERTYTGATYVNPPYTFNVDSTKVYQVKLRNGSADGQRPDLTAQISFP